jgi:hypothetical protein
MSLLNNASLVVTPNAYKEGTLYSVIPNSTLGDMTVVRATTATRVNSAGLIEVVPRNFLQYSNTFTNAAWQNDATITLNAATAPDGTMTAARVQLSSGANKYLYQGVGLSGVATVSCYIKGATAQTIGFSDGSATTNSINITTEWVRYTFTYNSGAGSGIQFDNYFGVSPAQQAKDFYIWHAQVEQGSTATEYFPTTTRLNIPRLDYSNGTCPSILVEPQRTNIVTYSDNFTDASWLKLGTALTVTANTTVSPDGTQNADTLNVSNNDNTLYKAIAGTFAGNTYTFSLYAKGSGTFFMNIRLNSLTITTETKTLTNQWQRFSVTVTNSTPVTTIETYTTLNTSSTYNIWGAQLEAGSYPTSYIPTTSAAVTRNADVISKTGISALLGTATGSAFVEFTGRGGDIYGFTPITLGVGVSNLAYLYVEVNNRISAEFYQGTVLQAAIGTGVSYYNSNNIYKAAFAWANNDFVLYINGTQIGTDTSGTAPTPTSIRIGNYNDPSYEGPNINLAALFPTRLTNAELAQLTTL